MTGAVIEYARGLAVIKSFGKSGAAMESVTKAIGDSKRIHLKIEWGYGARQRPGICSRSSVAAWASRSRRRCSV